MKISPRHIGFVATAALVLGTVATSGPGTPAQAAGGSITQVWSSGHAGHVGIDLGSAPGAPYENENNLLFWDTNGSAGSFSVPNGETKVRFEFYPDSHDYDPWTMNVGGAHVERTSSMPRWLDMPVVALPVVGQSADGKTGFRIDGDILSSSSVPNGRIEIDAFQIDTVYPDQNVPQPPSINGVESRAFATSKNKGKRWTGGVGWPGRYVVFVRDTATGRNITANVDIYANSIPTIDLDAICFGFDTCTYDSGGTGNVAGSFHPTAPTRILDTRIGLGITNGAVRTGFGGHPSPDPITRRDEIANHDLKVTGKFGIPESGVSAVLLNVTAVDAPATGFISVTPKQAHCCGGNSIFNDQGSIPTRAPSTSNLNVEAIQAVPNLVLARVGAGGKIRLYNSYGPTNVIADVAGWFGTGGAHTGGSGFQGIRPERALDSRVGIGTKRAPFAVNETRTLNVTDVPGIPSDAESIVINITAVDPAGSGFTTAFPTGSAAPNASNLNYNGGVRSNMAVVRVGTGGKISLKASEVGTHLIVDVLGSFNPRGGDVTAITPQRAADTRGGYGLNADETTHVELRGRAGVPNNATAVILNVTAINTTVTGYLTVYPRGAAKPKSSNVNFNAGQTVPNMVMVSLGDGGSISLLNGPGDADFFVDVLGYVT